jgi:hypothetical protein
LRQDEILQSNPYKSNLRRPQPAITNFFPDCVGNNDAKQDIEGLISETSFPNYHATRTPFFSQSKKQRRSKSPIDNEQLTNVRCQIPIPSSAATTNCRCRKCTDGHVTRQVSTLSRLSRKHHRSSVSTAVPSPRLPAEEAGRAPLSNPSMDIGWYGIGGKFRCRSHGRGQRSANRSLRDPWGRIIGQTTSTLQVKAATSFTSLVLLSDHSMSNPVKLSDPVNPSNPVKRTGAHGSYVNDMSGPPPQPAASRPYSIHPAHAGARETSARSRNYLTLISAPTVLVACVSVSVGYESRPPLHACVTN